MRAMTLWMEITNDEYELPVAVADTASELAKLRGTNRGAIYSALSKYAKRQIKNKEKVPFCRYRKIEIEEDD